MKRSTGGVMFFMGIMFAILAVVLYMLSIRDVDLGTLGSMMVANIQMTVFCAASAIASVVCFVGSSIIDHISRETDYTIAKNSESHLG